MHCGYVLSWFELLPILSFALLSGRCRSCYSRLSLQYPLVEFGNGLLYVLAFWYAGLTLEMVVLLPILSLLLLIFVYDLRHTIIPDEFSYLFATLALFFALLTETAGMWEALIAGPLVTFPLWLLHALSRGKWMGLGDAKLALGIGWLLGLSGGFAALLLSFWFGAGISLLLTLYVVLVRSLKRSSGAHTMKHEVPFAPYLVLGTLVALFCNITLIDLLQWLTF